MRFLPVPFQERECQSQRRVVSLFRRARSCDSTRSVRHLKQRSHREFEKSLHSHTGTVKQAKQLNHRLKRKPERLQSLTTKVNHLSQPNPDMRTHMHTPVKPPQIWHFRRKWLLQNPLETHTVSRRYDEEAATHHNIGFPHPVQPKIAFGKGSTAQASAGR